MLITFASPVMKEATLMGRNANPVEEEDTQQEAELVSVSTVQQVTPPIPTLPTLVLVLNLKGRTGQRETLSLVVE